ncbi:glycosyltransferase family 4 protein [Streptococcus halotolerans]|uniref:glycosyltransferase family 4 protein n=1 Tax=Streptococcus halotolerans TaxID=1814128 RepID=UPI0007892434|nr:glycosyltransferase family 4 protein [Streptococcus halotolerans]
MKANKIVIFSGFYLPFLGGVERFTEKLTKYLVKSGYQIIVVVSKHDDKLASIEENDAIKIYRLPSYSLFKMRYPILNHNSEFKKLMVELENESVDHVICNTRFQLTTTLGVRFANKKGISPLIIDHGSSHFTVGNRFLDFFGAIYEHLLTSYLKHFCNDFYAVSERSREWLNHFGIEGKGVIYNSVDSDLFEIFSTKSFSSDLDNKLVITYAGRIIREKGIEILLQAYSEIPESPDKILMVAGDGPILEELKETYQRSDIHFLGKLDFEQTMSLMNQTDIFVYPSMFPEGLPTSILEAGSLKSAVIATDRGGTREVISDPSLGIIIEENKESLHKALVKLISDETLRTTMQERLFVRVRKHFVWSETVKQLISILNLNRY